MKLPCKWRCVSFLNASVSLLVRWPDFFVILRATSAFVSLTIFVEKEESAYSFDNFCFTFLVLHLLTVSTFKMPQHSLLWNCGALFTQVLCSNHGNSPWCQPERWKPLLCRSFFFIRYAVRVERCRSWLRHCATSRKAAGSIPDGVIWIFHWHNPSCRTMALVSTQPLTEMSTRNIFWG